jgi:hypothetical protein
MVRPRGSALRASGLVAGCVVGIVAATPCTAQQARFAGCFDTIEMDGSTVLDNTATYEAVIRPDGDCLNGLWTIFCDHEPFQADKLLTVSRTNVFVFNNCVSGNGVSVPVALTDDWHHVAWVYDGAAERVYLDGELIAEEPAAGGICDAVDKASIGAANREGANPVYTSFQGAMESVRISSVARYTGQSFVPPMGDLTGDQHTQLLLNFNEDPGSLLVHDESPFARTGTLGVGFPQATSPELGCFFGCVTGDINGDGAVNAIDLAILIGAWGTSGPGDLDNDGVVGASDIAVLLGAWTN